MGIPPVNISSSMQTPLFLSRLAWKIFDERGVRAFLCFYFKPKTISFRFRFKSLQESSRQETTIVRRVSQKVCEFCKKRVNSSVNIAGQRRVHDLSGFLNAFVPARSGLYRD